MLDLVSNGRVEFGVGETSSDTELKGFAIDRAKKKDMLDVSLPVIADMMTQTPFAGATTEYFDIPQRNVVPKPLQRPHPPLWLACTSQENIPRAARKGVGALTFAFLDPPQAKDWVTEYYRVLEEECVPAGHAINPQVAQFCGFMCCKDEQEALDKGLDGAHFFVYSLGHYYVYGQHPPGRSTIWEDFLANRDAFGLSKEAIKADGGDIGAKVKARTGSEFEDAFDGAAPKGLLDSVRGAIGTPDQLRTWLKGFEDAGVDQVVFAPQVGKNVHEDVCASLELFAKEVMPEFLDRDAKLREEKARRLAPILEKAMSRKSAPKPADPDYVIPAAAVF
jgi:alkanesulfonate monooxygenase SsuD/methylene tetrahydromethanopterin reductase-like flavin-dependent oxidoreductase (luciferase family)